MPRIVRVDGANRLIRTLDIPDRQILVNLLPAHAGCLWEHHVAFGRVKDAKWMCWDTDDELLVVDLEDPATETHILGRNSLFPDPFRPLLTFDAVTEEQITAARSRAFQMIEMRGGVIPAPATLGGEDSSWLFFGYCLLSFFSRSPPDPDQRP